MGDSSTNMMFWGIFRHGSGSSKIIPLPAVTLRKICLMIMDEEEDGAEEEDEDEKEHCQSSAQ